MKQIHEYNGILMDSLEETYFAHWLDEAVSAGWVEKWLYVTKPFLVCPYVRLPYMKTTKLKTKIKTELKDFTLLHDLEYTPDFKVKWTQKGMNKFVSSIRGEEAPNKYIDPKSLFFCGYYQIKDSSLCSTTWVEVKPTFDMHGKISKFSVLQKILWTFKGLFVDLIIPQDLFKETWMPEAIMEDFKYKKKPTGKNKGKKGPGDWKTDYFPKTIKEFINVADIKSIS
jgi:hypothetical protein